MSSAPQHQDPFVGRVLDSRYEILQRIGEGGMGVVYKARQISIDRIVAIKMLNQHMAKDPNWVKRFNQEAKACSRLQHPNTIRLFDFGQTQEGRLFMTMEYLDGMPLREAIAAGAPMAPVRVLKILIQCCASLAEAHSFGIVHRDIKPDNVFLLDLAGSPDFVKLLDFSVAKLLQENDGMRTQAGVVFGTPQYMSPEQGRGAPLDARSDIYALGILGYEMFTGRVPFTDENPMNVLQMHVRQPMPPLPGNIAPAASAVVTKCLEKDPAARFPSATDMMQHCQRVFTELGAQAAGISTQPMAQPAPQAAAQKTMMAESPFGGRPPGPGFQPPGPAAGGAPPPMGPPPGRAMTPPPGLAEPEERTVAPFGNFQPAGAPPPAVGAPPPAGPPPGGPAMGSPVAPEEKTMMAMDAPALPQEPPGAMKTMMADAGMNPGMVGAGAPAIGPPGVGGAPSDGAPQKTMMLMDTEGVVSLKGAGAGVQPSVEMPDPVDQTSVTDVGGATPLFWVICLLTGLGVGVLAYVVVLQLG